MIIMLSVLPYLSDEHTLFFGVFDGREVYLEADDAAAWVISAMDLDL
jgi:hypothetical protein